MPLSTDPTATEADPADQAHPPPPAIDLVAVTKSFPTRGRGTGHTALGEITLSVDRGRFVALVGPNGCGKSTLLNLVAGLDRPSTGSIAIDGDLLVGLNRRATYMFQQDALLPWKTALDNVILGLTFRGQNPREARELGRDWLARVGLERFADHFPHQLSGGMRKRIAIAQSWITGADIVLMDEPFGALDVQTRELTEHELLRLWGISPKTVLLVTHDLAEAVALADEIVLLTAGPASQVVDVYPVCLPRPRQLEALRTDRGFNELYQTIWARLRTEVVKSYDRANRPA